MTIFVFSLIIFLKFIFVNTTSKSFLTVTIDGPNKTKVQHDVIEFIKEGRNKSSSSKKKAIMVLGLTGTGKSTLVNYLNGVKLVGKENDRGTLIVDLLKENSSLPGGFEIGHGTSSKTLYPAV